MRPLTNKQKISVEIERIQGLRTLENAHDVDLVVHALRWVLSVLRDNETFTSLRCEVDSNAGYEVIK